MNNIPIHDVIDIVILILLACTYLYMTSSKEMKRIYIGQDYRNFFKMVFGSLTFIFDMKKEMVLFIYGNGCIFYVYLFMVISSLVFIPSLVTTSNVWLPIMLFIIGISLLLHVYIKWINKYMIKKLVHTNEYAVNSTKK
jgi:hypothetical protein